MPKSVIFTSPAGVTRMLPGFTSRWITPASCAACRPSAACPMMSRVRSGVRRPSRDTSGGQRLAGDVLHDEVRRRRRSSCALAEVVDRGDVGVRQPRGVPRLGPEALEERRVVGVLAAQDLDRDVTAEHVVAARHTSPMPPRRSVRSAGSAPPRTRSVSARHRPSTALHHGLARSARPAALPLTSARVAAVLEDDRDGDLGLGVGRGEGHEPGVRLAALALLRGTGLAGHLDARGSGRWCRCRRRRPRCIIWLSGGGGLRADGLAQLARLGGLEHARGPARARS